MSLKQFALPDLGEGLTESEVVAWRVAVGDHIELNQVIADIETAKAVVELPSPFTGTVAALHAEPGQTIDVGAPLLTIESGVDDAAPDTPTDAAEPNLVGYGAATDTATPRRRARAGIPPSPYLPESAQSRGDNPAEVGKQGNASSTPPGYLPESVAIGGENPTETGKQGDGTQGYQGDATRNQGDATQDGTGTAPPERPRSTPPVRTLARELGVDLERVHGTGERGLITRADVEAAAAGSGATAAGATGATAPEAPSTAETRTPIKGVRKATAAAMVASAFTAPHVTEFLTVDATATTELIARLEPKVNILAITAKAVCIALTRTPELNSRWDEAAQEIVYSPTVNLGIAAATDRGLVVPNVKGADRMRLDELAAGIRELAVTAREGRTQPAELRGGTFTITNIGVFGIDAGTPILNPGEAGILALGAVRRTPWEHHGEIALRDVLTLSLSFDHRVVDGAQGSRFLADVGAILRDPARVLAMV